MEIIKSILTIRITMKWWQKRQQTFWWTQCMPVLKLEEAQDGDKERSKAKWRERATNKSNGIKRKSFKLTSDDLFSKILMSKHQSLEYAFCMCVCAQLFGVCVYLHHANSKYEFVADFRSLDQQKETKNKIKIKKTTNRPNV